ncbi:cytochrome c oxidase subunit II [Lysinibacillus capsici]|uniref:Cytochrome c oxidase subunit 2 n=1 Tax=Lysinibacillus capsici TaxID=2115968 RepID=A0ABY8KJM3_9BACI|nr:MULTISPECIES: cytochrome c oxidase subunit II [Lysinibacillus]AUS85595.1 cytochrome c oxidase subunit II [Lysinibacillus sp. YS11]MCT1540972.1 cytochrome c oxidase subunit II [Lysinibacillus capsici]MCT1572266.1 cytochrome c oxidase subunit II [Lysinibacillus capsici]MCT1649431.1 cytochrome c oxidase subunit II [Lysinibacillus capsici]MCT1727910.1 cytochrome c oxidase subunit II [Lysinibacillus capsici]
MMKGLKKWRLFSLLAVMMVFLSGCGEDYLSTLKPSGEVGKQQLNLLLLTTVIMTLVVVIVSVIYLLAFLKYRRARVGENVIPKQVEGSHTLEVIWTVIPIILLLIIAVPVVTTTYKFADVAAMDEVDEEGNKTALTINVTAKLYWWEFEYPNQGIVTAQELVVPTGEKVYFNLKAADVKHSFWIPAVGGKMDTNVENLNKFYLVFDKESKDLKDGVFYGKCAELCGPSHALMDFKVKTLSPDAFDAWVDAMKATEGQTADKASTDLGEATFANSCLGCHAISGSGAGGTPGPNLTTFGDRNRVAGFLEHNEESLKAWIKNPEEFKPGNLMMNAEGTAPIYGNLSDEEIEALATYIMGLSVEK